MGESLERSGTECITVAVRRERLIDAAGNNLLDFIDTNRYTLLPNTAGCFNADDAVRVARLGRELLLGLENPGADWVKLEVLADKRTLLPDTLGTLQATERLVADGFQVLCYTTDDPIVAKRLKEAGATSVMPAGSPIGSGQGILNPNNIRICLEYLKEVIQTTRSLSMQASARRATSRLRWNSASMACFSTRELPTPKIRCGWRTRCGTRPRQDGWRISRVGFRSGCMQQRAVRTMV